MEENHIDKDIGKEELKSSKDNSYLSLLREKTQYKQSELNQNKENEDNKKIKEDIIERNEEKIKQFDLKERKIEKRRKKENNNIENNTNIENLKVEIKKKKKKKRMKKKKKKKGIILMTDLKKKIIQLMK